MLKSGFKENRVDDLKYYTIPSFSQTGLVKHGFSSRLGGVSTGQCTSLNLGFKRKDSPENVRENFEIICSAMGISTDKLVFTDQVHKDKVVVVGEADLAKGFAKDSGIGETDGLITNKPGLALVTFYADCVPLYFVDPKVKAIGLAHAGWRGTVSKIGAKTVRAMEEHFGTDPADCLAGIGPSIGRCCFEVDKPVADHFTSAYPEHATDLIEEKGDKYHIDLWAANRLQLMQAGLVDTNITRASTCTFC
ncbi:MAG TPA: peptidoglycan editing factor PgeF, partial [Bacillota bacterium]|nr:peptidoglycan editing factor PgeF [Bacillota bacterium]